MRESDWTVISLFLLSLRIMCERRFILYLQPAKKNPLFDQIERYLSVQSKTVGINEAQQYPPHSSVIGFVTVDSMAFDQAIETTIAVIDSFLNAPDKRFVCVGIDAADGIRLIKDHVQLAIKTEGFRELAIHLRDEMSKSNVVVRLKPLDHISLAYISNYKKDDDYEIVSKYNADAYYRHASDLLSDKIADNGEWNLVLLEQTVKSRDLKVPHQFQCLHKWSI